MFNKREKERKIDRVTEMLKHANDREWDEVKRLIKEGVDINSTSLYESSLYDIAYYNSNHEMIRWLLRHGFKLKNDSAELHDALKAKAWSLARLLIHHGAHIVNNVEGENTLKYVIANKQWDFAATILCRGFPIDVKDPFIIDVFFQAAREGQLRLVKALINRGVSINAHDKEGTTALHHAIDGHYLYITNTTKYEARLPVIRYLLSQGINVNAQFGETACVLKKAINKKLAHIVHLLLIHHAKVNIKDSKTNQHIFSDADKKYINTWQKSVREGKDEVLHNIMQLEPEPHISDDIDQPIVIQKQMESKFFDINGKNQFGNTILFIAVQKNNKPNCLKTLLDYGADVNVDNHGTTATKLAIRINNPVTLKLIAQYATHINQEDAHLLMFALIKHNEWKLARRLARHGASLEGVNEHGKSLLQISIEQHQWKTARCLVNCGAKISSLSMKEKLLLQKHLHNPNQTILTEMQDGFFRKQSTSRSQVRLSALFKTH